MCHSWRNSKSQPVAERREAYSFVRRHLACSHRQGWTTEYDPHVPLPAKIGQSKFTELRGCSTPGKAEIDGQQALLLCTQELSTRPTPTLCNSTFLDYAPESSERKRWSRGLARPGSCVAYRSPDRALQQQAQARRSAFSHSLPGRQTTHLSPRDFDVRPCRLPALSRGESLVVLHAQLLAILLPLPSMTRNATRLSMCMLRKVRFQDMRTRVCEHARMRVPVLTST